MKTQTLVHPQIFAENQIMNACKRNYFRQKLFKCAVMIIILLQTACASNVAKLGGGLKDRTAPNPSKLAANGSGASLTCGLDMPAEVSARPNVQPLAQSGARMGARIILLLHNQQEMAGRLLSVRDNTLVISTNEAQDSHIDAQIVGITVVEIQDILRVSIEDNSSIRKGTWIGFLIGAGTGAIIGFAQGDDPPCNSEGWGCWGQLTAGGKAVIGGIFGGCAGAIVGAIVGGFVGAANSKTDIAIEPVMKHDFSALKPFAQFPEKEPEYLSAVK